jgi:SAM-dependent methyltransferase
VLSHIAILGGIFFVATRATRGRCTYGGTTARQQSPGHSRQDESMLLHLGQETKLRQWMLDLADLQPGNVLLDVGCGTGTLLLAAAQRVGPAGALHGIEPSPEMAAHARRKAEANQISLQLVTHPEFHPEIFAQQHPDSPFGRMQLGSFSISSPNENMGGSLPRMWGPLP